jgi:hypothetical protein
MQLKAADALPIIGRYASPWPARNSRAQARKTSSLDRHFSLSVSEINKKN